MSSFLLLALLLIPTALLAQIRLELVDPDPALATEMPVAVEGPGHRDHGTPEAEATDRLHFLNGDTLSGSLKFISGPEGLTWSHPLSAAPLTFSGSGLKDLHLKGPFPAVELEGLSRVRLTNGDEYRGTLVRMDRRQLVMDTPYAGEVTLAVPMMASLQPQTANTGIYAGPRSLEEWERNHKEGGGSDWSFRKGALVYEGSSSESLGQRFKDLPDQVVIRFDLAWRGNLQFYLMFWADDPQNTQSNYTLMLQHSYVRLYRHSTTHGGSDLGNMHVQRLQTLAETQVQLLLNRKQKEIYLILDGELIKRWTDSFEGEITGDALLMRVAGNTPTRIRNFTVRNWDGKFDRMQEERAVEQDILMLTNGDTFSGKLVRVEKNEMRFQTDFAELPVPLDRISLLELARADRELPAPRDGDVYVCFPTEERITLELDRWQEGEVTGTSEVAGEVRLQSRFISQLQFNPYAEERAREEDAW